MIILPVIVYSLTKSTVIMGLIMALYILPNILALPISGLIVDRINRVKLMMFTDIVRFILMTLGMVRTSSLWLFIDWLVSKRYWRDSDDPHLSRSYYFNRRTCPIHPWYSAV